MFDFKKPTGFDLIARLQPNGDAVFGGLLLDPTGTLPVTGTLRGFDFLATPRRPKGRPPGKPAKKQAEHIATLAHLAMSQHAHPDWGKQTRVLHFWDDVFRRGGRDQSADDIYRAAMEWVRQGQKATQNASGHLLILPESTELPLHWYAMDSRDAFCFDENRNLVGINGPGWFCRWGDKKAVRGLITSKPTTPM